MKGVTDRSIKSKIKESMLSEMEVPPELLQAFTSMLANAHQASATNAGITSPTNAGIPQTQVKPPTFSISEYKSSDGTTVEDYFKRFDWALELSRIPETSYSNYARVYIGPELNNALKFLVAPRQPEGLT